MNQRIIIAGYRQAVQRTLGIEGLPGEPIFGEFSARHPFNDFTNRCWIVAGNFGGFAELASLVRLKIGQQPRNNSNLSQGLKEGLKEVVAITPSFVVEAVPIRFSFIVWSRNGAQLMADERLITLVQERVDLPQRVCVVHHKDQFGPYQPCEQHERSYRR